METDTRPAQASLPAWQQRGAKLCVRVCVLGACTETRVRGCWWGLHFTAGAWEQAVAGLIFATPIKKQVGTPCNQAESTEALEHKQASLACV